MPSPCGTKFGREELKIVSRARGGNRRDGYTYGTCKRDENYDNGYGKEKKIYNEEGIKTMGDKIKL